MLHGHRCPTSNEVRSATGMTIVSITLTSARFDFLRCGRKSTRVPLHVPGWIRRVAGFTQSSVIFIQPDKSLMWSKSKLPGQLYYV